MTWNEFQKFARDVNSEWYARDLKGEDGLKAWRALVRMRFSRIFNRRNINWMRGRAYRFYLGM